MITRSPSTRPTSLFADFSVMMLLAAFLYGLLRVARHLEAPLQPQVEISLSFLALPKYALLSLLRGFVAYGLSLIFTLIYGYQAAHRPRAERAMVPLLDILQSIPVLGFLPGAVLALVALFPNTNTGLELACILMIFTGQVWNMTFSFYQSLKTVPVELKEAASVYQFSWWQRFTRVELPASGVGLAWNSMMAMAGGWFFLMTCEAFTLGGRDFRLLGLGSYLSVAIAQRNVPAIFGGIGAMVVLIVLVDTFVWRPVLIWAQKFKLDETASQEAQNSFVLQWIKRSWLIGVVIGRGVDALSERLSSFRKISRPKQAASGNRFLGFFLLLFFGAAMLWAAVRMFHLLGSLPLSQWLQVVAGAGLTLLRVFTAVILGSLWTFPAAIWIGRSRRVRTVLQPIVQVAASFPAPMLYPLILLALNRLGWQLNFGAAILMLLGTQWYILFNVIAGASSIPDDLREAAHSYQFTVPQRWRVVWWPAIFPYLITGWITAAGGAWNASIVAEYISMGPKLFTAQGLGSLISAAAAQGHYDLLAAGVLTMSVVVVFINRYLWKPLYRLAETRYAY